MKEATLSAEWHRVQEKLVTKKKAVMVFFAVAFLGVCSTIERPAAVTLPVGILYFKNPPSEWTVAHEECHYEEMKKEGWVKFYWEYFTGGGAKEEARCGDSDHPINKYFWMKK